MKRKNNEENENKKSFVSLIKLPVYALAKPIDGFIEKRRKQKLKKQVEFKKMAKSSELYSDFSVDAAENKHTSFKEHLTVFRANSLSALDCFYNALAIKLFEKKKNQSVKDKYADIPMHPLGWQDSESEMNKKGIYDFLISVLGIIPKIIKFFSDAFSFIKKNRFKFASAFVAGAVVTVGSVYMVSYIHNAVTEDVQIVVSINGNEIGMIENATVLDEAIAEANTYMSAKTGTDYNFNGDISYALVATHDKSFVSEELLYTEIVDIAKSDYTPGYVLFVDDVRIAANTSYSGISAVIDSLESAQLRKLADMGINASSAKISNNIRIENYLCLAEEFCSSYDLYLKLNGSEDIVFYQNKADTEKSDGAELLLNPFADEEESEEYGLGISALTTDDAESDTETLDVNLQYSTVVLEEVIEEVAYSEETEYSEYYELGTSFVKTEGINGQIKYTYEVAYSETEGTTRTLVSTEYIKEPTAKVTVVGVGRACDTVTTGEFDYPISGDFYISSGYKSYRSNTGYHFGIDLIGNYGDPIIASDGGIVTKAEWHYSYGYYVVIDHGNGYTTTYAHMSKILTEAGMIVYKGQVIGEVGDTGDATAPHLHFEIRLNGSTLDPMSLLPEIK